MMQLLPILTFPAAMCTSTELGIDIGSILQKTKAIVLHQMKSPCLEELDMGGALLFLFLLSGLHLLVSVGARQHTHCVWLVRHT